MSWGADKACVALVSALKANCNLISLDITGRCVGDVGIERLLIALESNPQSKLTDLSIGPDSISEEGAAMLLGMNLSRLTLLSGNVPKLACPINPSLQYLSITDETLHTFIIPPNSNLRELKLLQTCIRVFEIPTSSNLRYLRIASRKLTTFRCEDNCQLETLEIRGNIESVPVQLMPYLTKLSITAGSRFDVTALMENMHTTKVLTLELSCITLCDEVIECVTDYLTAPTCMLTNLTIGRHSLTADGMMALQSALITNAKLFEQDIEFTILQ